MRSSLIFWRDIPELFERNSSRKKSLNLRQKFFNPSEGISWTYGGCSSNFSEKFLDLPGKILRTSSELRNSGENCNRWPWFSILYIFISLILFKFINVKDDIKFSFRYSNHNFESEFLQVQKGVSVMSMRYFEPVVKYFKANFAVVLANLEHFKLFSDILRLGLESFRTIKKKKLLSGIQRQWTSFTVFRSLLRLVSRTRISGSYVFYQHLAQNCINPAIGFSQDLQQISECSVANPSDDLRIIISAVVMHGTHWRGFLCWNTRFSLFWNNSRSLVSNISSPSEGKSKEIQLQSRQYTDQMIKGPGTSRHYWPS